MYRFLFILIFTISFSAFSQKNTLTVYTEPSDFQHRIYVGSVFPFRMHAGYELQYKRIQVGGFVGIAPRKFQRLVFEILERIKPDYVNEINYLRSVANPKIQFGGEVKVDIGKGWSFGVTAQTFNATMTDTPKSIVTGILPEKLSDINSQIDFATTILPQVRDIYENKQVDAYMNSVVGGPVLEKTLWLNTQQTIFIRAKASYWVLLARENDLLSQNFTAVEKAGIDSFKPSFIEKLEKISSKLQAPSIGLELGIAF